MYSAIIIEPRKHKALSFVLKNFLENLSEEWNIIVFHGNLNIDFVNNIINNDLLEYKHRVTLINLHVDNLTRDEYSDMLIFNKDFYNLIPTETFLIFQTDSMIFSKNKHLINDFLKYDYVGAPWAHPPKNNTHHTVGNGGLSLRKKSKMLEIMDKEKKEENEVEDMFFGCTDVIDLYKPTFEEAKKFSVEWVFSEVTFGCHQPWIRRNELLPFYPEIDILMQLNDIV
jgi:hypothetical protein